MSPKTGSPQCSSSEPLPSGVEGSFRVGCGGCLLSAPCLPLVVTRLHFPSECCGGCQSAGPALLTALRRLQGLGWFCAVVCLHSGGAPVCGRPPGDRPIHVPRPEAVSPLLGVSGVSSVLPFYLIEYLITTLNVLFSLFTFPQILQNQ